MGVFLKVCGITSCADALAVAECGADAIGLMFYEPSPRNLGLDQASKIAREVGDRVQKVGVFVNAEAGFVKEAVTACQLDVAQFHGDESPEYCGQFTIPVWKAFRIRDAASLDALADYNTRAWLLDSYVKGQPGGTGERFNWDLAVEATRMGRPVVLAGGLNQQNTADAVSEVRPFGLDVSSGVESAPGRKDIDKVKAFVKAARSASGDG